MLWTTSNTWTNSQRTFWWLILHCKKNKISSFKINFDLPPTQIWLRTCLHYQVLFEKELKNCWILLTQSAITHQFEHTYKIIDSERSIGNERQKEILETSKIKKWKLTFFMVFQLRIHTYAQNLLKIKFTWIKSIGSVLKIFSLPQIYKYKFQCVR